MQRLAAALLLAFLAALPARAVLIDSGDGTGNTTAPADDPGWSSVGRTANGLNGIHLGFGWIVTAAHVGGGPITLEGVLYPMTPGSIRTFTTAPSQPADLVLYRIDPYPRALPALEIPTDPAPVGADVRLVGNGQLRGAATQWRGTGGWNWAGGSVKRWGTNHVGAALEDGEPPVGTTLLTLGGRTTESLVADFSEGAPGDEGTVTGGDSGGAVFVRDGPAWKLGGVTYALGTFDGQPENTSLYGNVVYAVDLSYYRDELLAIARPCDDGVDNDSDQAADFPADPGCSWIGDLSELPDCSDGIDNDNDGAVDLADSFCGSAGDLLEAPDFDSDGATDAEDDCAVVANPTQIDTDQDGYGNACDADYDDDGLVDNADFNRLRDSFGAATGSPGWDPELDANDDGMIGNFEFNLLRRSFLGPPGPSGLACAGGAPCP